MPQNVVSCIAGFYTKVQCSVVLYKTEPTWQSSQTAQPASREFILVCVVFVVQHSHLFWNFVVVNEPLFGMSFSRQN